MLSNKESKILNTYIGVIPVPPQIYVKKKNYLVYQSKVMKKKVCI